MNVFARAIVQLWTDPGQLRMLVSYFIVPVFAIGASWLLRYTIVKQVGAGMDMFAFLTAMDLTFFNESPELMKRVNPLFSGERFHPVVTVMLVSSILLLLVSARVETRIKLSEGIVRQSRRRLVTVPHYPLWGVVLCWFLAIISMSIHMYFAFGGGSHG